MNEQQLFNCSSRSKTFKTTQTLRNHNSKEHNIQKLQFLR